jgi:hypothetical protein
LGEGGKGERMGGQADVIWGEKRNEGKDVEKRDSNGESRHEGWIQRDMRQHG